MNKNANIRPPRPAPPGAVRKRGRQENDFVKPIDVIRLRGGIDRPMLLIIVVMLCFGLVMVFSASYAEALTKRGNSFYYVIRQTVFAVAGFVAMLFITRVDYRLLHKFAVPLYIVSLALLVTPLVYGIARGVARRWIPLFGISTFQPSELMKFALVVMLAAFFARYQRQICDYSNMKLSLRYGLVFPFAIIVAASVLIALEPHFSCIIILFLIGMIVMFAGGTRKLFFVAGGAGAGVVSAIMILFVPYVQERLDTFIHPENYSSDNQIYQTLQGLYAVGSGGFFGVGLGNSRQKHLFVSEPQNDFIFSIICEELGFVGAMAVIILFALFIWRGVVIALRAPDTFSSLVVVGLVGKVAVQALLNMAVITSLVPNTGIALPFFSSGGTALLMQLGEMGILLSISRYSYKRD